MGLRIIGGSCRGRKLRSLSGLKTRPTADRMRESLFNIISSKIQNAVVLDLFAGTGALGIEALSRGAKYAAFIENSPDAILIIKENVKLCQMHHKTDIIKWNIENNLDCLQRVSTPFDIVFMDPPYNRHLAALTLNNLKHTSSLRTGTNIIIEHDKQEEMPKNIFEFEFLSQRKYGKTVFSFFEFTGEK